jgi:hypothetical protein
MRYFRPTCRLASLIACGLSLLIMHQAYPIAAKAYNDLCSIQGTTFGEGYSVRELGIAMLVLAVPLFLTRSNALIATNAIIGLVTIAIAGTLLITAANTPYECFTQAGTYEDNTSGLEGLELWLVFAAFLSYVLLTIDLAIWSVRKLMALRAGR